MDHKFTIKTQVLKRCDWNDKPKPTGLLISSHMAGLVRTGKVGVGWWWRIARHLTVDGLLRWVQPEGNLGFAQQPGRLVTL